MERLSKGVHHLLIENDKNEQENDEDMTPTPSVQILSQTDIIQYFYEHTLMTTCSSSTATGTLSGKGSSPSKVLYSSSTAPESTASDTTRPQLPSATSFNIPIHIDNPEETYPVLKSFFLKPVGEFATSHDITYVRESDSMMEAITMLQKVSSLPVLDLSDDLIAVITRSDLRDYYQVLFDQRLTSSNSPANTTTNISAEVEQDTKMIDTSRDRADIIDTTNQYLLDSTNPHRVRAGQAYVRANNLSQQPTDDTSGTATVDDVRKSPPTSPSNKTNITKKSSPTVYAQDDIWQTYFDTTTPKRASNSPTKATASANETSGVGITVLEYLAIRHQGYANIPAPVYVTVNDNLRTAVILILSKRIHRVFIRQTPRKFQHAVAGVITLSNIVESLYKYLKHLYSLELPCIGGNEVEVEVEDQDVKKSKLAITVTDQNKELLETINQELKVANNKTAPADTTTHPDYLGSEVHRGQQSSATATPSTTPCITPRSVTGVTGATAPEKCDDYIKINKMEKAQEIDMDTEPI